MANLIDVFVSGDLMKLELAKSRLDSAQIPFVTRGLVWAQRTGGHLTLKVYEENAEKAQRILEGLQG